MRGLEGDDDVCDFLEFMAKKKKIEMHL